MLTQTHATPASIFAKYSLLTINGRVFRSSGKSSKISAVMLAVWDKNLYGSTSSPLPSSSLLPAFLSFCKQNVSDYDTVLFACVVWFFPHPHRDAIGKPVELWCPRQFEPFGLRTFVPVSNITCRCTHGLKNFKDEELLIVG